MTETPETPDQQSAEEDTTHTRVEHREREAEAGEGVSSSKTAISHTEKDGEVDREDDEEA